MSNNYDSMHSLDLKPNPMYMPNPSKRLFHDAMETPYSDTSLSSKTKRKDSQRQDQKSLWSMEEDKLMKKLLKDAKPPINWKRVAEHFHDKNELQCQTHWEKLTNPELYEKCKKKPWTEEEDALVIELVQKHGPQKWTFIADHLPGRIGKQCRERWHNHLNPKIKKSAWTNEEEWLLFLSHKAAGSRWAEITKNIPGRTDNSIKNHWNSSMKKRIPELTAKFQRIRETGGLTNPVNVSNISALEYELLEKTLTMDEGDYHVKNETTYETKKPKAAKNKNYEPKGRSKNSSTDMKHYSSQNHLAKIDDTSIKPYSDNTTSSPNSMMDSLRKIQDNAHNSVFDNLVKTKLDFSIQDLDPKNPEHLQLINQIYHQPNMQAYYNSHQSIAPADYNHSRPHFGDDHSLGKDNSHYMSKKEPEYHKQNEHTANTSFYTKEFGIQSPALKLDTKPFGNEATNDQYFHQNNENRNTLNYSKPDSFRDNALFESPPQRKKQKFNPMHSPNIPDTESNSKTNSKILDRTNRANLNIQGFPKDFVGFNAYAYSPLNLKYESPSKMMNFCTPERNRDVHLDSAGKQIFFNMNPIEKSPSLFINKNYYTFDKPSTLKF